jgi:hypothetical protein
MRCDEIGEKIILEKGKEEQKVDVLTLTECWVSCLQTRHRAKWGLRQRTEYSTTIPLWRR